MSLRLGAAQKALEWMKFDFVVGIEVTMWSYSTEGEIKRINIIPVVV